MSLANGWSCWPWCAGWRPLPEPARVTLVTPSRYVNRGLTQGLPAWRTNGWQWEHFGDMVPVKNRDLWQRIDRASTSTRSSAAPGGSIYRTPGRRRPPQASAGVLSADGGVLSGDGGVLAGGGAGWLSRKDLGRAEPGRVELATLAAGRRRRRLVRRLFLLKSG